MTYNELFTVATTYRAINKHGPRTLVMNWFEELAKRLLQKFELEEAANAVSTPSIDGIDNNTDHVPVPNNYDTPSYPTAIATIASNSNAGVTLSHASAIVTVGKGRTGRPKQQNDSLKEIIYTIIKDTSNEGLPNSTYLIHNRLEQDFNIKTSPYQPVITVTRDGQGQEWILRYPEGFLDESYCHLDHTNPCRWVIPGVPVTQPGHSPLLVIFAAFVVWFDGRRVRSKLVDGSVYIWLSKGQALTKGPGTGRRAQHDAAMWNEVPDFSRDANIVPPNHNYYHGNFTAELFDKMFTGACKSLQDVGLEKCRIHFDGASYHFHKASSKPAGNKKADLAEWIQREDFKD
ncbi:hypothetical protein BGX30_014769 [Mortierella sp. GBA39]|nr:hypothetical protein BGX30_014769 [Mortierella sp. GBA39]